MQKMLTIIIPVYNEEKNIKRCLESIFNQTFSNFEIIVVNDASTDKTLEELHKLKKYNNFSIITLDKNSGAGKCRNVGLQKAITPYVTFVDSDDWVDINAYERCFDNISEKVDVIIYGLIYDYVSLNRREIKYKYDRIYTIPGDFALNIYSHTIPNKIEITPIVNNKIYRTQFLSDNNIHFCEDLRYQEDDAFTFEVLSKASTVVFVDGCAYHYCQNSASLTHRISELSIRSFINAYVNIRNKLMEDESFEKYKTAYYLKLKSSMLGVIKRILDLSSSIDERNKLLNLLISLLVENFDFNEILSTLDFSIVRSIL